MSATRTAVPGVTTTTGSLLVTGVVAAALASAATMIVAAAGNAAGISLDLAGAPIPVPGFAVLTAIFSLVGLVLAVVLTVLSLVPDVIADATPATKALLMLTHLVAAAIVIPAVARRARPVGSPISRSTCSTR
jgi:hypothetical protein